MDGWWTISYGQNRCLAGNARADDSQDARNAGRAARLRHRAPDRADERPQAARQLRHALPRAPQARTGGLYQVGLGPDEARRRALLKLGGVEPTKERYRDQQRFRLVDTTIRELRQAAGRLRRSPAFTAAAILSLALAIAANVAVFAVVERVVIHP